jgi:hypothetical protein
MNDERKTDPSFVSIAAADDANLGADDRASVRKSTAGLDEVGYATA